MLYLCISERGQGCAVEVCYIEAPGYLKNIVFFKYYKWGNNLSTQFLNLLYQPNVLGYIYILVNEYFNVSGATRESTHMRD